MTSKSRITHGATGSRTYRIWVQMKNRCLNRANKDFKDYGGRGIKVCDRWRDSFESFLADMGEVPDRLTIDRYPDKDGDYAPGNCRWTTMKEQNRNRRSQVMVTHEGRTQCISAWAEEFGVYEPRFRRFMKQNMPLEKAVQKASEGARTGPKTNATGLKGVKRSLNKWIARIQIDGKRKHLGTFETADQAAMAYQNAAKELASELAEV